MVRRPRVVAVRRTLVAQELDLLELHLPELGLMADVSQVGRVKVRHGTCLSPLCLLRALLLSLGGPSAPPRATGAAVVSAQDCCRSCSLGHQYDLG